MKLSENALEVLNFRYLQEGETVRDMFNRVVDTICLAEPNRDDIVPWRKRYYELISSLKFIPNTPTLINAGRGGQLSACFVLEIKDSIESIFGTLGKAATVHKSGGGTGFDFSQIRPANSLVKQSNGVASGPVSFMRIYNAATREMKQGGVRRGANMAVLRVDHPDILKFIECKQDEGEFENFNISVAITDEFIEAVRNDVSFDLKFNCTVYENVQARDLLTKISKSIWLNGEPGIIFIDKINDMNPMKEIETIASTNPCGEQPLPENGSCNLGHINLARYWNGVKKEFDFETFRYDIETAVRFLDNAISVNNYPTKEIEEEALDKRRIGLGIMGVADLFLIAGYDYGSTASAAFISNIMEKMHKYADNASKTLGEERGTYGAYHYLSNKLGNPEMYLPKRRNATLLTVAPTGSCSIIANCSSGCEPVFAFEFEKKCIDKTITMYHPLAEDYLTAGNDLPRHFITAKDVSVSGHLRIQASIQQFVDSGISKTINVPESYTKTGIYNAIIQSFLRMCKSVTFYRDKSRKEQAQYEKENAVSTEKELQGPSTGPSPEPEPKSEHVIKAHVTPYRRSRRLDGFTYKIKTGRGKLYVTINEDSEGQPVEVFAKIGKSGKEDFAYTEAIGRLISIALRSGVPIERVYRHLKGITGFDTVWDYGALIKSVPDAIARVIDIEYNILAHEQGSVAMAGTEKHPPRVCIAGTDDVTLVRTLNSISCPECGSNIIFEEGCQKCLLCGFSKCGG